MASIGARTASSILSHDWLCGVHLVIAQGSQGRLSLRGVRGDFRIVINPYSSCQAIELPIVKHYSSAQSFDSLTQGLNQAPDILVVGSILLRFVKLLGRFP